MAVFSGFFSSLRYFVETLAVSEAKCLPSQSQSGFTVASPAWNYPNFKESHSYWYELTYMAHTDMDSAIDQSCGGWYWWMPAAIVVGITIRLVGAIAIHFSNRSKQGKKSFSKEVRDDFRQCTARTKPLWQSFLLRGLLVPIRSILLADTSYSRGKQLVMLFYLLRWPTSSQMVMRAVQFQYFKARIPPYLRYS